MHSESIVSYLCDMKRGANHTNAFFATAALLIVSTGCGSRHSRQADSDSVLTEETADVEPARLPDTVYASAEALKYNVEELAPATDGRLESLRDLYSGGRNILTFRGGPSRDARPLIEWYRESHLRPVQQFFGKILISQIL